MADTEYREPKKPIHKELRELREHLIRLLFMRDFYEVDELEEQNQLYFDVILPLEGMECTNREEILEKYSKIVDRLPEIDSILTSRMQSWNLKRIGLVEKSILRLSAYEIIYDKLTPGIAIDEAVEIAKIYCLDKSSVFVNGVLANIVKGLDDNGK